MEKNALSIILCIAFCLNLAAQSQDKALDSLYYSLPESMVTGERPIVKADKGKLVYDLPHIIRNLPVDNAYDAIKELPGVIENDGSFSLAGKGAKVVIDGKVTNMTQEQLNTLLKSIPSSSIANAEVMYSAPARYQVRGAMINITLKKQKPALRLCRERQASNGNTEKGTVSRKGQASYSQRGNFPVMCCILIITERHSVKTEANHTIL